MSKPREDKMKKVDERCPHCGYCPHCGRSDEPVKTLPFPVPYPYPVAPYPRPTYPWRPTWGTTPTITCGSGNLGINAESERMQ